MVSGAMRPGDGLNHSTSSDAFAKTLRFGLAAALMLFAVQSAIGLFAALALNSYDSVFDLDRNNGIPDLLSTGAILATAFGAAKLAAAAKRDRWQAATLALLLAVVAVDDLFQQEVDLGNAWGMSVAVALVPSALLIVVIALRAPRRAALTLLIGLFLLVVAVKNAYEYDQFLNILGRGDQERGDFDYELGIVLKQGLELLGWSFVAIGIWATALATGVNRPQVVLELEHSSPRETRHSRKLPAG
jgi:hypothetical protein